jgi:hypothetical protein
MRRRETEEADGGRAGQLSEELVSKVLEAMQPAGQDGSWGFSRAFASVRLLCSQWKAIHDAMVTRLLLRPVITDEAMRMLVQRFPAVVSIKIKGDGWGVGMLTDQGLRAVSILPALTSLNISSWQVSDEGVRAVSSLPALTSLSLSWCDVTSEGLRAVSRMPALTFLDISRCEKVTDLEVRAVSRMPALT